MTSFMVVDEERSDVSLRTVVRTIRPEFRRTLLERSGSPRNMFEGELSSAPSRRAVWGGAPRSFASSLLASQHQFSPIFGLTPK
jgi:hypothetical protein